MKKGYTLCCRTAQLFLSPSVRLLRENDDDACDGISVCMGAMSHAMETYIGRRTSAECRRQALEAIRLLLEELEKGTETEKLRQARLLAKTACGDGCVGYVHAMAQALSRQYGTSYGKNCAVLLPVVLEAYGEKAHKRLHAIGVAVGVSLESDRHAAGASQLIGALKGLNGRLKISKFAAALRAEDLSALAYAAAKEANPLYSVPAVMGKEELETLYGKILPPKA